MHPLHGRSAPTTAGCHGAPVGQTQDARIRKNSHAHPVPPLEMRGLDGSQIRGEPMLVDGGYAAVTIGLGLVAVIALSLLVGLFA